MSDEEQKLLACPFCGGKPYRHIDSSTEGHYIECKQCRASSCMMFPDKCDVWALLAERRNALADAMERFTIAGRPIPLDWIHELKWLDTAPLIFHVK